MKSPGRLFQILVVVLLIIAAVVILLPRIAPVTPTADLEAVVSAVEHLDGKSRKAEPVPDGAHRTMYEGDGVGADDAGYAKLDMNGCILGIFRNSEIQVEGLPTDSAPVCIVEFEHGTIYSKVQKETVIDAQWAVITSLATEFLVHLDFDKRLIWVIVREGAVEVAAAGQTIIVKSGWQTWVFRGHPPESPVPATRPEVGDLFPPIDDLTNGILKDQELLEPGEPPAADSPPEVRTWVKPDHVEPGQPVIVMAEADDDQGVERIALLVDGEMVHRCTASPCEFETEFGEPGLHVISAVAQDASGQTGEAQTRVRVAAPEPSMRLEISLSTDKVIVGECVGPHTVEIVAALSGSREITPGVGRTPLRVRSGASRATIRYHWEGVEEQTREMKRLDVSTFGVEIGPFKYCCQQTPLVYTVEVFDPFGALLASRSGKVLLEFCIA